MSAEVVVLRKEVVVPRPSDIWRCPYCDVCTEFKMHRDGSITCWGCEVTVDERWFDPTEVNPGGDKDE